MQHGNSNHQAELANVNEKVESVQHVYFQCQLVLPKFYSMKTKNIELEPIGSDQDGKRLRDGGATWFKS